MNTTKIKTIKKEKRHAFKKDIYLLGRLNGKKIWLEQATWDCDWYWGFGYIETYTNDNNPEKARDISMHTHYNSICFKKDEETKNYIYILSDITGLTECTLTRSEQWQLSELMKSFYTLKESSAFFYRGKSNSADVNINFKDDDIYNKINKEILPSIFSEIYKLLSP